MAVTFDAVGPSSAGTFAVASATLSWSHTSSGNTRLIVVVATLDGPATGLSLSATCDGNAMISDGVTNPNNQVTAGINQMWHFVGQAAGSNAIVVTLTGSPTNTNLIGGSVSFNGVDQNTPVSNFSSASGSSAVATVTITSALGNMVVDGGCAGSPLSSSGQNVRWLRNFSGHSGAGNVASSTANGDVSVVMKYIISVSDFWAINAMNVNAATVVNDDFSWLTLPGPIANIVTIWG